MSQFQPQNLHNYIFGSSLVSWAIISVIFCSLGCSSSSDSQIEGRIEVEADSVVQVSGNLSEVPDLNPTKPKVNTTDLEGYQEVTWPVLAKVSFEQKFYEEEDQYFLYPTFDDEISALDGKEVYISGYTLPVNPDSNIYVLSAFNFSSCFFCGQAGPESILELDLGPNAPEYLTDQWATFKGTMQLNSDDLDHLYYILNDAVEIPSE